MMRPDPRIRQNIDRISTSLESAADNARTGCFTFTKSYLEPCLSSLIHYCTACLPPQGKNSGLHHRRAGGRYASSRQSEFPFAFYDYLDYGSDEDEGGGRGFLAWGTDELDRLLAGSGTVSAGGPSRPGARRERMYYGAVGSSVGHGALRRKGTMEAPDPTVIPSTSMFGLLSRFGFRSKGMRYKPSAANLQEHPQRGGAISEMNGNDCSATGDRNGDLRGNNNYGNNRLGRKRSETRSSSGDDSLRSRGDLWPSDDEDDAVVIGDDAFPRSSDSDSTTRDVGFGLLGVLQDDGGRMVDGQDSVQLEETTNTAASDDVKGRNVGMNVNSNMNMNMDMKERSLQLSLTITPTATSGYTSTGTSREKESCSIPANTASRALSAAGTVTMPAGSTSPTEEYYSQNQYQPQYQYLETQPESIMFQEPTSSRSSLYHQYQQITPSIRSSSIRTPSVRTIINTNRSTEKETENNEESEVSPVQMQMRQLGQSLSPAIPPLHPPHPLSPPASPRRLPDFSSDD